MILSFQRRFAEISKEYTDLKSRKEIEETLPLMLLVAKAKTRIGDYTGALKMIEEAMTSHKDELQLKTLQGMVFYEMKEYRKATETFSAILHDDERNAKAWYWRGLSRTYEGDDRGVQDLTKAIRYNTRFFDAFIARASFFDNRGEYVLAILDCNEALKLEPSSLQAHLLRGTVSAKVHKYVEALEDFGLAITVDAVC
jgi:tetratricopeptide (TPR) repeat protein